MKKSVEQKKAVSKGELRQLAETLAIFQQLPKMERIAIQYYIKGRVDANSPHIGISVADRVAQGKAAGM